MFPTALPTPVKPISHVHFVVVRQVALPLRAYVARFQITVEKNRLSAAVHAANLLVDEVERRSRRLHVDFRLRAYSTSRREIFVPGPRPEPPHTVYVVQSRLTLRSRDEHAIAPLVSWLANRATLLVYARTPSLSPSMRRRILRHLDARLISAVRREAQLICQGLGDHQAIIHTLVLSHGSPRRPRPLPIFSAELARARSPLPISTPHARLVSHAQVDAWCGGAPQ